MQLKNCRNPRMQVARRFRKDIFSQNQFGFRSYLSEKTFMFLILVVPSLIVRTLYKFLVTLFTVEGYM